MFQRKEHREGYRFQLGSFQSRDLNKEMSRPPQRSINTTKVLTRLYVVDWTLIEQKGGAGRKLKLGKQGILEGPRRYATP